MRYRVLAIVSPPGEGGIIPQARAIQAHLPDEIVMLNTYFPGKNPSTTSHRLKKWINGSKDLVDTYSDLLEFIDLPHTPPLGFIQRTGAKSPHVVEIDVPVDDLFNVLQELESKYENSDFRFDILPGSKRVLAPVLLSKSLQNTKITYSLEEGGFLILHNDGENELETGPYLSLIDRFWLTGIPVYAENEETTISKYSKMYSAMLDAQSIEFRTSKDKEREAKRKKAPPPRRLVDLPLNMRNKSARRQFNELGGRIESSSAESINYQFEDLSWEVQTEEHDFKLGNDIELIAANEIKNHWDDIVEIYQGVSFLSPSKNELKRQVKGLVEKDFKSYTDAPDKMHTAGQFLQRCERLGVDIRSENKDITLEELVELEINQLTSLPHSELVQHLWMMRSAEIDILTLGKFGVSMFDVKQAIWRKEEFTNEKSATQMAQNIVIREEEKRWIVNSTSPFNHPKLIHMTRLVDGRDVIKSPNRFQWRPTQFNLNLLKTITEKELQSKATNDFQHKTGVKAKTLRKFFPVLFKENPSHPIFKIKKKRGISGRAENTSKNKSMGSKTQKRVTQVVTGNDTIEDAIHKIGKALVEEIKTPHSKWSEACSIISSVISPEEKKRLFGSKKFTLAKAKVYLRDYVVVSGKGMEAVVQLNETSKHTNKNPK